MIKQISILFFLLVSITSFSQKTLSDYSYVVVPDQFSFLEGKDKYKINSLSTYLFNKFGFNAFLNSEVPNVKRCDGLYADLDHESSFFRTKLTVILKDCNGNIVYTGKEGNSKFKEYRRAYQDATRKAFESVERLNVQQKDIELAGETEAEIEVKTMTNATIEDSKTNPSTVKSSTMEPSKKPIKNISVKNLPRTKFLNYTKGAKSYLLRKTNQGYSLYEESTEAENGLVLTGTITVTNSEVNFKSTEGQMFDVYFDEDQNLSLFKGDGVVLYKLVR